MNCISINFKNTPEEIRGVISYTDSEKKVFFNQIKDEGISGLVIVSTCNRTEFYFDPLSKGFDILVSNICSFKKIDSFIIKKYGLFFEGNSAINHLFRVVFGLESMVLGEDEIFHQVKEAYLFSDENNMLTKELNIIFQDAFHAEKESKQETAFKSTPISIGTLTANYIEEFLSDKSNSKVLIVGASGQIGSVVARDLIDKGISVVGTTRKTHHSKGYYVIDSDKITWVTFEERLSILKDVDVVVSATTSPHFTLTKDEIEGEDKTSALFIDLAIPFDIDRDIELLGKKVVGIDFFKTLSKENNEKKKDSIEKAEEVLCLSLENTEKKLFVRSLLENDKFMSLSEKAKSSIFYLKDSLSFSTFSMCVNEILENV